MHAINEIVEQLKKHSVKVTPQRIAIINYLTKNYCHPSAEDIFAAVSKTHPTITRSTVYNTLEKLEEIKEIVKLKIGDSNKVNYDYNIEPHSHFFCKKCNHIYDVGAMPCDNLLEIDGHRITETSLYFKGVCKNCLILDDKNVS